MVTFGFIGGLLVVLAAMLRLRRERNVGLRGKVARHVDDSGEVKKVFKRIRL